MLAAAEGRISQFVRSRFKRSATEGWNDQWAIITAEIMRPVPA
jgi:TetR/AcrR family transcriptional regulator